MRTNIKNTIEAIFTSKRIIVILIVIALGLGGAIYRKNNPSLEDPNYETNKNSSLATNSNLSDENLTEEERILLYHHPKDATEEQRLAFAEFVNQKATEGDTIVVKDCTAKPIVLKTSYNSTFTVDNQGTTDINFGVSDERTLVKAGSKAKIKANYRNGPGIYGYGCDDTTLRRSIGVLLLTK